MRLHATWPRRRPLCCCGGSGSWMALERRYFWSMRRPEDKSSHGATDLEKSISSNHIGWGHLNSATIPTLPRKFATSPACI
jgi:hypothetical protein